MKNYARELLQLFSVGLYKLNDHGNIVKNNGLPLKNYTQTTVSQLARVFTGLVRDGSNLDYNTNANDMIFANADTDHDFGRVDLQELASGAIIEEMTPSSQNASARVDMALDYIYQHPSVAPFLCKQLIQRLVTSNPSGHYIFQVVNAYRQTGGNIQGVLKAILLYSPANSSSTLGSRRFGKIREPMLRIAQWGRTFGINSDPETELTPVDGGVGVRNPAFKRRWQMVDFSSYAAKSGRSLAQSPLRSPSVFNYFRPDNILPGSIIYSPEFQLVNDSTVIGYINLIKYFIFAASVYKNPSIDPPPTFNVASQVCNYGCYKYNENDTLEKILNDLNLYLTANQLTDITKRKILYAMDAIFDIEYTAKCKLAAIKAAIFLIMVSPDYLMQK